MFRTRARCPGLSWDAPRTRGAASAGLCAGSQNHKRNAPCTHCERRSYVSGTAYTKSCLQGPTGLAVTDIVAIRSSTSELFGRRPCLAWAQGNAVAIMRPGNGACPVHTSLRGSAKITALAGGVVRPGPQEPPALWLGRNDGSVQLVGLGPQGTSAALGV